MVYKKEVSYEFYYVNFYCYLHQSRVLSIRGVLSNACSIFVVVSHLIVKVSHFHRRRAHMSHHLMPPCYGRPYFLLYLMSSSVSAVVLPSPYLNLYFLHRFYSHHNRYPRLYWNSSLGLDHVLSKMREDKIGSDIQNCHVWIIKTF